MRINRLKIGLIIIRIILCAIFIFSALSKLLLIDSFELFIYGFDFLNFNISSVAARLIIGAEFIFAIAFLFNFFPRLLVWSSNLMIWGLTFFLIYVYFFTNETDCFCFGESFKLSIPMSISKNVIILAIIYLYYRFNSSKFKYKLIIYLTLIISLLFPFIISPPDFIFKNEFKTIIQSPIEMDGKLIKHYYIQKDSVLINTDKSILCFFSTKCKFCKLAVKKISVASKKYKIPVYIVFWGKNNDLDGFWEKSTVFPYIFLESEEFFKHSGKSLPAIYFVKNNKLTHKFGFRTLTEDDIKSFSNE